MEDLLIEILDCFERDGAGEWWLDAETDEGALARVRVTETLGGILDEIEALVEEEDFDEGQDD